MGKENIHINFDSKDSGIVWEYPELYSSQYLRDLISADNFVSNIDKTNPDILIVSTLCNYVNNLWDHDGMNEPEKPEPLCIISEIKKGKQFRCVEYSILLDGFLKALEIPSRVLSLKTSDVETRKIGAGHVVVEYYSRSFEKWILVDPQVSFIPIFENVPLNAVELQKHLTENKRIMNFISNNTEIKETEIIRFNNEYFNFVYQYLYYFSFKIVCKSNKEISHLMLMPKGVCMPGVFQIKNRITGHIGSNSILEFYRVPFYNKPV